MTGNHCNGNGSSWRCSKIIYSFIVIIILHIICKIKQAYNIVLSQLYALQRLCRRADPGLLGFDLSERNISVCIVESMFQQDIPETYLHGFVHLSAPHSVHSKLFQFVIDIDPKNVEAYLGMAETYIAADEQEKAVKILERITISNPMMTNKIFFFRFICTPLFLFYYFILFKVLFCIF